MSTELARARTRDWPDARRPSRGTNIVMLVHAARRGPAYAGKNKTNKKTHQQISSRGRNLQEARSHLIEMAAEFAPRLWIQGVVTVTTGVGTPRRHTRIHTLDGSMTAQKLADTHLNFRPRPTETHAAGGDQTMRVRSPRPRRIREVNADRGCRRAASQQARPRCEIRKIKKGIGSSQTDLLRKDRGILGTGAAGDNRSGVAEHC